LKYYVNGTPIHFQYLKKILWGWVINASFASPEYVNHYDVLTEFWMPTKPKRAQTHIYIYIYKKPFRRRKIVHISSSAERPIVLYYDSLLWIWIANISIYGFCLFRSRKNLRRRTVKRTINARSDMHNWQACGRNSRDASACDSPTVLVDWRRFRPTPTAQTSRARAVRWRHLDDIIVLYLS